MKPGHGKLKGGKWERQVCLALSRWVTNGARDDVFWRSAMSGGRATLHGPGVRQCGDIAAVAIEGYDFAARWFVDCKHVKDLELDKFLVRGTGELAKFWRTACREAARHEREPMIIALQNFWPALVFVRRRTKLAMPIATSYSEDVDIIPFHRLLDEPYDERPDHRRPATDRPSARSQPPRIHAAAAATRPRLRV